MMKDTDPRSVRDILLSIEAKLTAAAAADKARSSGIKNGGARPRLRRLPDDAVEALHLVLDDLDPQHPVTGRELVERVNAFLPAGHLLTPSGAVHASLRAHIAERAGLQIGWAASKDA